MIRDIILYAAVFLGCFFEGETSLIVSSFTAHRGYLEIYAVMAIAFIATVSWDWLWFSVGRYRGREFLKKRPKLRSKARKIDRMIRKYPVPILLGYRFLYGFRTAVPLAAGMSSISRSRFLFFSLLNILIWDILFSSAGYYFGAFMKANLRKIESYELEIIAGIIISGIITGLFLKNRSVKRFNKESSELTA
jgi:membrane protein DedA with SNARE-associated domain